VPLGLHPRRSGGAFVSSIPMARTRPGGHYAQLRPTVTAPTHLHPLPTAVAEDHLLGLQQRVSWECRMRIRPQRSSIGYGFLLGAVVTVDVLLIAAILALHALQAWLAH